MHERPRPEVEPGRFEQTQLLMSHENASKLKEDIRGLEAQMNDPMLSTRIEDPRAQTMRLRNLKAQLRDQEARPYKESEIDRAIKREAELREKIQDGMPTSREQRHNPAGNIDKHKRWEKRQKKNSIEWKNIVRRMEVTDQIDIDPGYDNCNVERLRPRDGDTREANLDNCAIPVKKISMPPGGPKVTNGLEDEEFEALRAQIKEMAQEIQELRAQGITTPIETPGSKRKKRKPLTEEQRQQRRENLVKARAARAAKSQVLRPEA